MLESPVTEIDWSSRIGSNRANKPTGLLMLSILECLATIVEEGRLGFFLAIVLVFCVAGRCRFNPGFYKLTADESLIRFWI